MSTNIRSKCVKTKMNLRFDVMENDQIFPSKVCLVHYGHRFLFGRTMRNIRSFKEVRL